MTATRVANRYRAFVIIVVAGKIELAMVDPPVVGVSPLMSGLYWYGPYDVIFSVRHSVNRVSANPVNTH